MRGPPRWRNETGPPPRRRGRGYCVQPASQPASASGAQRTRTRWPPAPPQCRPPPAESSPPPLTCCGGGPFSAASSGGWLGCSIRVRDLPEPPPSSKFENLQNPLCLSFDDGRGSEGFRGTDPLSMSKPALASQIDRTPSGSQKSETCLVQRLAPLLIRAQSALQSCPAAAKTRLPAPGK